MTEIKFAELNGRKTAYRVFGSGKISVVIELALGAVMSEWAHIPALLPNETVLIYERAGVGSSQSSKAPRTPKNIAYELKALLDTLYCEDKITLIAHSQGGLYAQQFARLYPELVAGLILLDPLSANDSRFKQELTPAEFKKSGVDKFSNLGLSRTLAKLHLGFIIKAVMKSAPPFYYYKGFSPEASAYILNALTKPSLYDTAMTEYAEAHKPENLIGLAEKGDFPDIPLVLITHSSPLAVKEAMEFGTGSLELAEKVEALWQELMKEYLAFSPRSQYIAAEKSTHFIHLTQPELITRALGLIDC